MQNPRPRVLVVEDQPNWHALLAEILSNDCDVVTAEDLETATECLQQRSFDVVSIDIRLRDKDPKDEQGMQLFEIIHQQREQIGTIVVTGYPTFETMKRALGSFRAFDYLLKSPEDGSAFDRQRYLSRVLEAAKIARAMRMKQYGGSKLSLFQDPTQDEMVRLLTLEGKAVRGSSAERDMGFEVNSLITNLLQDLEPLLIHPTEARVVEGRFGGSVLQAMFWSRALGKAIQIQFGDKAEILVSSTKNLVGVVVVREDLSYEDFNQEVTTKPE